MLLPWQCSCWSSVSVNPGSFQGIYLGKSLKPDTHCFKLLVLCLVSHVSPSGSNNYFFCFLPYHCRYVLGAVETFLKAFPAAGIFRGINYCGTFKN